MYEMLIAGIKASPVVDMDGYPYLVHPLTNGIPRMDPAVLREVVDWIENTADLNCDVIVAPESMGIPLAVPVSLNKNIPYSVVRKRSYRLPNEVAFEQKTGYSSSTMYINGVHRGDRVTVIDDVVSTGGTLIPMLLALRDTIGAEIADVVVPIDKDGGAETVARETGIRVRTLVGVSIGPDRKVHCELS